MILRPDNQLIRMTEAKNWLVHNFVIIIDIMTEFSFSSYL